MAALVILLRFWQPKENYVFDHEKAATKEEHNYTGGQIFRAWTPYLFLTLMVLLWGLPSVKTSLDNLGKVVIPVTGLDNMIVKKVSTPEVGLQKIAVVNTEIDKLTAALPKTDEKVTKTVTLLGELKTLEGRAWPPLSSGSPAKAPS